MSIKAINSLKALIKKAEENKVSIESLEFINNIVDALPGDKNYSENYNNKKATGDFTIIIKCKNK